MGRMASATTVKANVLLIGLGPHAQRTYIPSLQALGKELPVAVKAVVELESYPVASTMPTLFGRQARGIITIQTPPCTHDLQLSAQVTRQLDAAVAQQHINAVIIATPPQAHMQYALWAAQKGLHILMDKPLSSYEHVITLTEQAKKLQRDYKLLVAARQPDTAFLINVQRRYRPDFQYVLQRIDEIAARYRMPITSMQCTHADGQWRLPAEIVHEPYHGYNAGSGKISHGGYHLIDIASQAVGRSYASAGKTFDEVGVYTSTVRPAGLLKQQAAADYDRVFGSQYAQYNPYSDEQLAARFADFGEVDASSLITLYNQHDAVGQLSINLLHNSFSRRSWLQPNTDLYNSNGRVRHEYYSFQQGPYQNIQIHAYHADQEARDNLRANDQVGENEHFDIYIFRNSGILGGEPLEIVRGSSLAAQDGFDKQMVLVEQAKTEAVREMIEITLGMRPVHHTQSDLATHNLTATLYSLMYQAAINGKEKKQRIPQAPAVATPKRIVRHKRATALQPHIRILGVAGSGKTTLAEELARLQPDVVPFARTPEYVYAWLQALGIGDVSHVDRAQAAGREQVFKRFNEHESKMLHDILPQRPVAAIRGRADTLITHTALRERPLAYGLSELMPEGMRPDVLVVLTTPLDVIEQRLRSDARPQTGAHSLAFHARCQEMYLELARLAKPRLPVLVFDTATTTPQDIASQVAGSAFGRGLR